MAEAAKSACNKAMEQEAMVKIVDTGMPYVKLMQESVEIVKGNVEPAKIVLGNIASLAKADIQERGIKAYALSSAEALKAQGIEAIEVCKAKVRFNTILT
jgi:hypothetical protein